MKQNKNYKRISFTIHNKKEEGVREEKEQAEKRLLLLPNAQLFIAEHKNNRSM
jgi:hypothetical protein